MRNRKKLKQLQDYEEVSPAFLMDTVLNDTPENLTFSARSPTGGLTDLTSNFTISIKEPISRDSFSNFQSTLREPQTHRTHRSGTHKTEQYEQSLSNQIHKMKEAVDDKKKRTCKIIFEKNNILESIVKSQKIKNLQNNFVKKVQRTSSSRQPVEFQQFADWEREGLLSLRGVELPTTLDNCLNVLSVLQITTLTVIYSLSIVFDGLQGNIVSTLQTASLIFYFIEILVNFISVKSAAGKKVEYIKEICLFYLGKNFLIDVVSLLILFIDINLSYELIGYFRLFIVFKLPQCLEKIQKLEVYFIQNVYNEQYWELIKVFFFNFCYAHIIALFLAGMSRINPGDNWMSSKGIDTQEWYEQYVWSYYWANTIMLTVGFGDLVASNYQQAICLIFIETFSCIMMAYNINCVGGIIANIRYQDQQRSKKFKIFKKLTDHNNVPPDLSFKINNYIEESSKLRKKFNYQEDKQFLNELPSTLKASYLREANKEILKKLMFFRGLLDRTLCNFAQNIETRISHPQQIIRAIDDDFNLIILRKGQIGYACRKGGCRFNDQIVDLISVKQGQNPFLTSLDFISKKRPLYEIKSLQFSVLFTLDYDKFISIFKQTDMDYELYCFLRDKIRNIPDEFEVHPCQYCQKFNHFKFTCPRLHYLPYEQHVINRELYHESVGRNNRTRFQRNKVYNFSPIDYYKKVKGTKLNKINVEQGRDRESNPLSDYKSVSSNINQSQIQESKKSNTLTNEIFESLLDEKTREVVSMEFVRLEKKETFEDDVWLLNCDVMTSYNSYFSQDNPYTLADRFSPEARLTQKIEKAELRQHLSLKRQEEFLEDDPLPQISKGSLGFELIKD